MKSKGAQKTFIPAHGIILILEIIIYFLPNLAI